MHATYAVIHSFLVRSRDVPNYQTRGLILVGVIRTCEGTRREDRHGRVYASVAVTSNSVVNSPIVRSKVRILGNKLIARSKGGPDNEPHQIYAFIRCFGGLELCVYHPSFNCLRCQARAFRRVRAQRNGERATPARRVTKRASATRVVAINQRPIYNYRTDFNVLVYRLPAQFRAEFSANVRALSYYVRHNNTQVGRIGRASNDGSNRFLAHSSLRDFQAPVDACVARRLSTAYRGVARGRNCDVTQVVFHNRCVDLAGTIPVGDATRRDFHRVSIELPVDPLALPLRSNYGNIVAGNFFLRSRLGRSKVAVRRVASSGDRLRRGFPVNVFLLANFLAFLAVLIPAFFQLTMFFHPRRNFFMFREIMSALVRAARGLNFIRTLVTRAWVFLGRVLIGGASNCARTLTSCQRVTFSARLNRDRYDTYPARGLLDRVFKCHVVFRVLRIATVGTGYEGSLLNVTNRRDYRVRHAQTFHAIGSPRYFQPVKVRVRHFETMTPTEDREGHNASSLTLGFLNADHALNRAACNTVYGRAPSEDPILVSRVDNGRLNGYLYRARNLFFRALACAALAAVGHQTSSCFKVFARGYVFCEVRGWEVHGQVGDAVSPGRKVVSAFWVLFLLGGMFRLLRVTLFCVPLRGWERGTVGGSVSRVRFLMLRVNRTHYGDG